MNRLRIDVEYPDGYTNYSGGFGCRETLVYYFKQFAYKKFKFIEIKSKKEYCNKTVEIIQEKMNLIYPDINITCTNRGFVTTYPMSPYLVSHITYLYNSKINKTKFFKTMDKFIIDCWIDPPSSMWTKSKSAFYNAIYPYLYQKNLVPKLLSENSAFNGPVSFLSMNLELLQKGLDLLFAEFPQTKEATTGGFKYGW